MNTLREDRSLDPFTPGAAADESRAADNPGTVQPARLPLPAGWRRLATGLRGTWLYQISSPYQCGVHWVAEMKLNGKLLSRRFASELQARGWLTTVNEPRASAIPFDLEERHGPLRAAGVRAPGRGLGQTG